MDPRLFHASGLAAALLLAACTAEQVGERQPDPATTDASPLTSPELAAPAANAPAPGMLLDRLAAMDEHGLALAKQAASRPLAEVAAEFAATLRQDHAASLEATRTLQGAARPAPASDAEAASMRAQHRDVLQRLAGLEDDQYQRAWVDAVVGAHTVALEQLDNTLIPGAGDDIHGHLEDRRRAYARHLEAAQRLRGASQ